MLTTSVNEKQHSLLQELVEQIDAVCDALETARQQYELLQHQKEKESQESQPAKTSWGLSTTTTGSRASSRASTVCVLPPGQHPIVLGVWAASSSDTSFRAELGRVLQDLLLQKRRHMGRLELAREGRLELTGLDSDDTQARVRHFQ